MRSSTFQIALAEGIGTFTLIFIGVLSISHGGSEAVGSLIEVAFAHGLAIAVMVAALGAVSGGHFNPAVTFGFVASGRMSVGSAIVYWGSQLVGATAAAMLLVGLFGAGSVAVGTPAPAPEIGMAALLVLEFVATFFLVLVIFGTAVDSRAPAGVYPLAIGLTITLGALAIGPMTGAALNPARAFGPALASGTWSVHWAYWVAPLLGGAVAGLIADRIFLPKES